jgi:hypothetical protein
LANSSPILLSRTGSPAAFHRKEVIRGLTPHKFVALIEDLWHQERADGADSTHTAMKAIAEGMLGIELTDEESSVMKELARAFKKYSSLPIPANLLRFNPEFRKEQAKYQQCIENILQREIEKITSSNPEEMEQEEGLLRQEIIKKMEANPNRTDLHKDPDLKSILLLLAAVDNLDDALARASYPITQSSDQLRREIQTAQVLQNNAIDPSILMDSEKMPHLDRLYRQAIQPSLTQPIVGRYIQNGLQCGEHRIPPHTYLAITTPTENRSPHDAFSAGRRSCPARIVAEAVFKTIVVCMVCNPAY